MFELHKDNANQLNESMCKHLMKDLFEDLYRIHGWNGNLFSITVCVQGYYPVTLEHKGEED